MKRVNRFLGVFLCALVICTIIMPTAAYAASTSWIDTSASANGYFTVCYNQDTAVKMKVGITFNGKTTFHDYTHGETSNYVFTQGDGNYTITLYRNVRGTSYTVAATTTASVSMQNEFAPYLASTAEITFSADDSVGKKAAELCGAFKDDAARVVAIHNFISQNFTYNYDFAGQISSGKITNYVPDTQDILSGKNGICYDFSSLFAAMCRSQEIPCKIQKGYYNGIYHAWNLVYVNDAWQAVDTTASVGKKLNAASFVDCVISEADSLHYKY